MDTLAINVGWGGGEGPVLVGVVEAAAEVEDGGAEGLAGPVEGAAGEADLGGGADDVGRPDRFSSPGEELVEPTSAEVKLGRRGACEGGSADLVRLKQVRGKDGC